MLVVPVVSRKNLLVVVCALEGLQERLAEVACLALEILTDGSTCVGRNGTLRKGGADQWVNSSEFIRPKWNALVEAFLQRPQSSS